jgi:hypothetical protein
MAAAAGICGKQTFAQNHSTPSTRLQAHEKMSRLQGIDLGDVCEMHVLVDPLKLSKCVSAVSYKFL